MSRRSAILCANPVCRAPIPQRQHFCRSCWRLLPAERRVALVEAKSRGQFAAVSALAIEGGAWLRDHNPAAEAARRLGEGEA